MDLIIGERYILENSTKISLTEDLGEEFEYNYVAVDLDPNPYKTYRFNRVGVNIMDCIYIGWNIKEEII